MFGMPPYRLTALNRAEEKRVPVCRHTVTPQYGEGRHTGTQSGPENAVNVKVVAA